MDKIAVLMPCYNESNTIDKVVKDFKSELPEAFIYAYDDRLSSTYFTENKRRIDKSPLCLINYIMLLIQLID